MAAASVTFESLLRAVGSGQLVPVYLLHGKEGYFIDRLVKAFENILPEEDRDYGLTNIYAPQVPDPQAIVDICRQIPMMTERQVVIVREAQSVRGEFIDRLAHYASSPTPSTILVVASRGEKIKGREFAKAVAASGGVVFESKEVYASQIPALITKYIKEKKLNGDPKAVEMLGEYIGTNLSRLYNEIDKLVQILGPGAMVTPEAVERNIGVSKDYNNFELVDAIAACRLDKMMRIVNYFAANPRQNPYVVTVATVFAFFADLLQAYYAPDKSDRGLEQELGLRNSFMLKRIRQGMSNYNAFQIIEILDAIRRYDAQSKGSGSRQDPYLLLGDLMYRIATAPGTLPV